MKNPHRREYDFIIIFRGAVGFALGCGVVFLGPVIPGTATASGGTMTAYAFGISTGMSFLAGTTGYAIEEEMNNREVELGDAFGHGISVAVESRISYGVGGIVGSMGTTGSLDFGTKT